THTALAGAPPLRAVTCVGTLCVASGFNGEIWTTTAPLKGASSWTSVGQPAGEQPMLGLTCVSEALCFSGVEGGVLTTTTPTVGWAPVPLSRRFQIVAVACPTAA